MFQCAKQNEESLLPPGEGQDEGIINGKLHDPLTPTLSLREREPSGKYPEKLICRSTRCRPRRRARTWGARSTTSSNTRRRAQRCAGCACTWSRSFCCTSARPPGPVEAHGRELAKILIHINDRQTAIVRLTCQSISDPVGWAGHGRGDEDTMVARSAKESRRAQLLQCAKVVFAERGYHAAGIADIIAAAGVARGTFYFHFESKRQIFDEILDNLLADIARRIAVIEVGGGGAGAARPPGGGRGRGPPARSGGSAPRRRVRNRAASSTASSIRFWRSGCPARSGRRRTDNNCGSTTPRRRR